MSNNIVVDPTVKKDHRYFQSEDAMLQALQLHVKSLKLKGVASPNYNETGVYSTQWKAQGAVYLYRIADKTFAVAIRGGGVYIFDSQANIRVGDGAGYGDGVRIALSRNTITVNDLKS